MYNLQVTIDLNGVFRGIFGGEFFITSFLKGEDCILHLFNEDKNCPKFFFEEGEADLPFFHFQPTLVSITQKLAAGW